MLRRERLNPESAPPIYAGLRSISRYFGTERSASIHERNQSVSLSVAGRKAAKRISEPRLFPSELRRASLDFAGLRYNARCCDQERDQVVSLGVTGRKGAKRISEPGIRPSGDDYADTLRTTRISRSTMKRGISVGPKLMNCLLLKRICACSPHWTAIGCEAWGAASLTAGESRG
jgi:hypothetical protein